MSSFSLSLALCVRFVAENLVIGDDNFVFDVRVSVVAITYAPHIKREAQTTPTQHPHTHPHKKKTHIVSLSCAKRPPAVPNARVIALSTQQMSQKSTHNRHATPRAIRTPRAPRYANGNTAPATCTHANTRTRTLTFVRRKALDEDLMSASARGRACVRERSSGFWRAKA